MIQILRSAFALCMFICMLTGYAAAQKTTFLVSDADGNPVRNAVVTVPGKGKLATKFTWPYDMKQQDMMFDPYVLIVPVGAEVKFPNADKVRHHVYSFSKGNKFELKLFGKDETRSVTMQTVGVASLGCNIHDDMVAYIRVVDTPYAAKTDADGKVTLELPEGAKEATVWHPDARPGEVKVALPASRSAAVSVTLKVSGR
jgi:plastocyanin